MRTLEVTVATLGNFISSLAYGKTDIEIPNDVLRILSQLNMVERRRSLPKSSLTDVNVDSDTNQDLHMTLGQIKSQSLLPKSGSSFFAKSFDQIRQQKLGILSSDGNMKYSQDGVESKCLKKSLSDSRNIKFDKILEEPTDRSQSLGRVLNSHEMETLKMFQKNYSKEFRNIEVGTSKKPALKSSKSNFELGGSQDSTLGGADENTDLPYPLNCGDIQISFSGPTKLKSLRPSRTKSDYQIQVPQHFERNIDSNQKTDHDGNGNNSNDSNKDSAFEESIKTIDLNANISDKSETTVSFIQDSKLNNSDITIS